MLVEVLDASRKLISNQTNKKSSGVLLPISCLPGEHAIGDMGTEAYRFIDFLKVSGQRWWQLLPLHHTGHDGCPYNAVSAFAGDPSLVSLEQLLQSGWLMPQDIDAPEEIIDQAEHFEFVQKFKNNCLRKAYQRFSKDHPDFQKFCGREKEWLEEYSLFCALKNKFQGLPWSKWPAELRSRDSKALNEAAQELNDEIGFYQFIQYVFFSQWHNLKSYANERGIGIIGDLPLYMAHECVDVWTHQDLFDLDADGEPVTLSGVPPDYFSKTGQLWGHPTYRWEKMRALQFDWWIRRIKNTMRLFDTIRLDHFIGLIRYWSVPAGANNARDGQWIKGPGDEFFQMIFTQLEKPSLIAENLGILSDEVESVRKRWHIPGMRVLQFELPGTPDAPFDGDRLPKETVLFTGTHDNDTLRGWFGSRDEKTKAAILNLASASDEKIHQDIIRLAFSTAAQIVIVPIWDWLGLGSEARFNTPGTIKGNWQWRLPKSSLSMDVAKMMLELTKNCHRINHES
ncbi:MAG: 4-alpha-glucanotransferase [Elusimicrobia bacterium]|nr:4-alpha-glucanotransferase [Elusimicrobiota bacterium]